MTSSTYKVKVRALTNQELKEYRAANCINGVNNDFSSSMEMPSPPHEILPAKKALDADTPNTVVIVKNTETLDEYQIKV